MPADRVNYSRDGILIHDLSMRAVEAVPNRTACGLRL